MILLKDFYGLSDFETEEMIIVRISLRKFMKLVMDETRLASNPDAVLANIFISSGFFFIFGYSCQS
jgi:hypothetical protein